METISLQDFIKKYWPLADISSYPNGMNVVESIRNREKRLNKFLPPQLLRRLDTAFARSNTVHPEVMLCMLSVERVSPTTSLKLALIGVTLQRI